MGIRDVNDETDDNTVVGPTEDGEFDAENRFDGDGVAGRKM